MPQEWRERVVTRLAELGINDAELARRLGSSKQLIRKLLRGEQQSSALVPALCEITGIPAPYLLQTDTASEVVAKMAPLTESEQRLMLRMVEAGIDEIMRGRGNLK